MNHHGRVHRIILLILRLISPNLFVMRLCTLSLNSCHHIMVVHLVRGDEACFRMRVTLGVILIRSLVNTKHISGRLRSGSGVALEKWVHEEVI